MRARHRYLLLALVVALAIALAARWAGSNAHAVGCSASTSWDNVSHRCG